MKQQRNENTGFTLVELSIVLVIIGLLIGGILVAQSVIGTAKIQSFVGQVQQYDIAVSDFQTKYHSLPGDSSAFGCVVDPQVGLDNNTCDNGQIESNECTGACYFESEIANFWPHLQQSGFTYKGKTFSSAITNNRFDTTSITPNSPSIDLGDGTGGVVAFVNQGGFGGNVYAFAHWTDPISGYLYSTAGTGGTGSPIMRPQTALAVDTKMDDALPRTGNVQNELLGYRDNPNCDLGINVYNLDSSEVSCFMSIRLLTSTGTGH